MRPEAKRLLDAEAAGQIRITDAGVRSTSECDQDGHVWADDQLDDAPGACILCGETVARSFRANGIDIIRLSRCRCGHRGGVHGLQERCHIDGCMCTLFTYASAQEDIRREDACHHNLGHVITDSDVCANCGYHEADIPF